jgi:hypothetical protein
MREIEEELRKALQALRKELDQLLFPEEARRMDEILEQLSQHSRDPAICNQAMDQVMDLILKHSIARQKLVGLFGVQGGGGKGGYSPPAGEAVGLPPGTKVICPMPDCKEERVLHRKGETFYCPEHREQLVQSKTPLGGK